MNAFLTGSLLAASMVLGQHGEPVIPPGLYVTPAQMSKRSEPKTPAGPYVTPAQMMKPSQPAQRPILNWFNREDRPIITRIQNWFKRDPQEQPQPGPFIPSSRGGIQRETPAPPPLFKPSAPANDFPRRLPASQLKTSGKVLAQQPAAMDAQQASLQQADFPKRASSPILPQFANKMGRDEHFEWITGQFEFENGNYVVYYATPETIDKYNGRVVLMPKQGDLKQFRKGDLISIRGQLTQRPSTQGFVPIYRIQEASLIERAKN